MLVTMGDYRGRNGRPRARSVTANRMSRAAAQAVIAESRRITPDTIAELERRPRTRAECSNVPRPCPWVGCRHHLYLDVNPENGTIKLVHPDLEPEELARSCSLDVAEEGEHTLESLGELMNLTRERMRQIESKGLLLLGTSRTMRSLARR